MTVRRFCDLDGTIIFSRRHEINDRIVVEKRNGADMSFMFREVYEQLQALPREEFVPITNRTKQQYDRIQFFADGKLPCFALIDNGGILLKDGIEDEAWTKESMTMIAEDIELLIKLEPLLSKFGETRMQDGMILFIKQSDASAESDICECINEYDNLQMFKTSRKTYVCSAKLTKGSAVRRFRNRFPDDGAIAAGDSPSDLTMAEFVDRMFCSRSLEDDIIKKMRKCEIFDESELGIQVFQYM